MKHLQVATFKSIRDELLANTIETGAAIVQVYIPGVSEDTLCLPYRSYVKSILNEGESIENNERAKGFIISPWSGKSPDPINYIGDQEVLYEDVNFRFKSKFNVTNCTITPDSGNTLLLGSNYKATVSTQTGYTINSVIVKVGETIVQSGTNTTINLTNILGDVEITATATLNNYTIDYVNIIDSDCVESTNTSRSIDHGLTYTTTIRKKEGYATLGPGSVTVGGVQMDSWNEQSGDKEISVVATGNIVIKVDECGDKYKYTAQLAQGLSNCVTLTGPTSNIEYGSTYRATLTHTAEYATLGAITVTMGGTLVRTYPAGETQIDLVISGVNGNIVIDGECGTPADATVTYIWYDTENQRNIETLTGTISYGRTIQAVDHQNDCTLPVGYEIKSMNPTSITGDGTDKTIIYNCGLKEYTVTYVGQNVTIPTTSQTVSHGGNVTNTYTVNPGYSGERATADPSANVGNATAQNGTVNVTTVTGNVRITITAGLSDYIVTYSGDNITLTPSQTVSHRGNVENPYTLDPGYEIVSVTPNDSSKITDVTYDTQKICVNGVVGNVNIDIVTRLKSYTVTYQGDANCNIPANTKQTVQHEGSTNYTVPVTTGYRISGVTIDDSTKATATYNDDNVVSVTNVTGNVIVTVSSTKKTYEVTFSNCGDSRVNITKQSVNVEYDYSGTINEVYTIGSGYMLDSVTATSGCMQNDPTSSGSGEITLTQVRCDTDICISAKPIPVTTHTVTFRGETGITLADSQITVNHGSSGSTTYTLSSGYLYDGVEICDGHGSASENNGTITVTNVTEDITVCVHASQGVNPLDLYASNMDAMGGVRLYATDGTNFDTNPEHFTINSVNGEACDSENVEVFDYDFVDSSYYTGTDRKTGGPAIINKKRVNLENTGLNPQFVTLNVTYKNTTKDISITQREESYGYYTGIDNDSSTQDLFNNGTWKAEELVDFGDSSNMYGATTQGNDIYNKDVTPYYIKGTDIGENPLSHVDSKATIIKPYYSDPDKLNYNTVNPKGRGEHYHIEWGCDNHYITHKGIIFDEDSLGSGLAYCGEKYTESVPLSSCSEEHKRTTLASGEYTVEALSEDGNVYKEPGVGYTKQYVVPRHKYGRDSISYYHIDNNDNYKSVITGNKFKQSDGTTNNIFSYPVHISISTGTYTDSNTNPLFKLGTVRWESGHDPSLNPTDYSYNYYDYNNRIDINEYYVIFAPYNEDYYDGSSDLADRELTDDHGREVRIYYTAMSYENRVRPKQVSGVNGGYQFYKLNDVYSSVDRTNDYNNNQNLYEFVELSEYKTISDTVNAVAYVTTDDDHVEPVENVKYPYYYKDSETYLPINTDFSSIISSNPSYEDADSLDSDISIYRHTYYNLCTNVVFEQHYNGSGTSKNHYLYNSSNNKCVECASHFTSYDYDYYTDIKEVTEDGQPNEVNWEDIVDHVIHIVKDDSTTYPYYFIEVINDSGSDSTTYRGYKVTHDYYPQQTLDIPELYMDGSQTGIDITFYPTNNQGGINKFVVTTLSDSTTVMNTFDSESGSDSHVVNLSGANANYVKRLKLTAYTHPTNCPGGCPDFIQDPSEYESVVHTGAGVFEVTVYWDDGDERKIYIPIGGSCSRTNNPDSSGTILTWEQLSKNYYYDGEKQHPNTNDVDDTNFSSRLLFIAPGDEHY